MVVPFIITDYNCAFLSMLFRSDGNLVKDDYLRSQMDDQGWVPLSLIATFPMVSSDDNSAVLYENKES